MTKRLYRSEKNAILAGICGGIGEYTEIDPVVIRLIWVILSLVTGIILGIIIYLIAILIVPEAPKKKKSFKKDQ